jgi:hypothetical protein
MLREMEKTAKREHRTLSELVRENFRRSQEQAKFDIGQLAPPPPGIQAIWEQAKRTGAGKLTMDEINREVRAVRRKRDRKTAIKHTGQ